MSAQWMVYAVLIGALLTLAALVADQGSRLARRAGRTLWALAMVTTVALPLLVPRLIEQPAPLPGSAADNATSTAGSFAARARPTLALSGFPATPTLMMPGWSTAARTTGANSGASGASDVDRLAIRGWQLASALTLAWLVAAAVTLQRRRRRWQAGTFGGAAVLVSADSGPAVVGVLRPRVVIPAWLMTATPARQRLVMAHELAHIAAGDTRLLAALTLLLVAMPWNLPLWFQWSRLRRAIEIDCDARVLAGGYRLADYGAALIDVAAHGAGRAPLAAMPLALSRRPLEQRLRRMAGAGRHPPLWQRLLAPVLLLLALDIGVAAARIAPPPRAASNPTASDGANVSSSVSSVSSTPSAAISVPLAERSAVAGYYQLGANRVAIVSASATGLTMTTNMEPRWALQAASNDQYFLPATSLRVAFNRAAGTVTLVDGGVAADPAPRTDAAAVERADAYVAARVASGAALPGGAAIVRRNVGALTAAQLQAADFAPGFLRQARARMPEMRARTRAWGAVQAISFDGVNRWGWDCYKVRYANRTVTWAIWLDEQGRLAGATMMAPPP